MARQRHERVNMSLVGQQVALSPTESPQLLNTIAPRDRVSGSGEVSGKITVPEMSANDLEASSLASNA